ncbi:hypothetical protein Sjap_007203 [Stephania japonica]|uniref:Vacuolar ATPase assembly protein VMA22 n=1 Tax=Stephania japonica TaxID=461633 RepID=A0AAP0JMQ7_9MAGN
MEELKVNRSISENGREREDGEEEEECEKEVLQFLDSMDSYIMLIDSLSSTLRQGWLDLASARHSMGPSRINSGLFDLKLHAASSTLNVTELDDEVVDQPYFTLSKWPSLNDKKCDFEEIEADGGNFLKTSNSPQLRHRGSSDASAFFEGGKEEPPASDGSPVTVDNQVQKERSKSLSVFGTLVSPKLRNAQLSFEKALEMIVQLANERSTMLSAHAQICRRHQEFC